MIAVKLGGSIITDKQKEFSINKGAIDIMASQLSRSGVPMFIVHGGGSWGHTMAKKFGLSDSTFKPESIGVGGTKAKMLALSYEVQSALISAGLEPFYIPAQYIERSASLVRDLASSGCIPMSFGDVIYSNGGFRVMGGDEMIKRLNDKIHFKKVIFAMNTPGVLDDTGATIDTLTEGELHLYGNAIADVTGGIAAKLKISFELVRNGTEVCLLKGDEGVELLKALNGESFHGTTVRVVHDY